MSEVYIAFGTLLSLGIVFPGLLFSGWLLFPQIVSRAERRLAKNPGRSFWFGLIITGAVAIPILGLLSVSLPFATVLGVGLIIFVLGVATLGAAGLTHWMARRLKQVAPAELSESGAFLRAAIALELGAAFPFIGWFLLIPFAIVTCLGAAVWAILGREPKLVVPDPQPTITVLNQAQTGAVDVA